MFPFYLFTSSAFGLLDNVVHVYILLLVKEQPEVYVYHLVVYNNASKKEFFANVAFY